jgi:hypothetical protein
LRINTDYHYQLSIVNYQFEIIAFRGTNIINLYMKMKKMIYLMLLFILLGAASMTAQVTIGANEEPHGGAVLDLSQVPVTGTPETGLGLLLPRLNLQDVAHWQLAGEDKKASAQGMMIYNTNADVTGGSGQGIYVWDGGKWEAVKSTVESEHPVVAFTLSPSESSVDIYAGGSKYFEVSEFMPENASYPGVRWTIIEGAEFISLRNATMTHCYVDGIAAGTAKLEIKSLDGEMEPVQVTITVNPVTLVSFVLPETLLLKTVGTEKSKTLEASDFKGSDGLTISGYTVVWEVVAGSTTGSISPESGNNTITVTAGTEAGTFTIRATAGSLPPKECTVTVVKLTGDVPDATHNPTMSGSDCWDVREDKSDPGAQDYTVAAGSSVAIRTVDWEVIESLPDQLLNSQSGSGNTLTLNYKDRASLETAAGVSGQTVTVSAFVTYEDNKVVQISKTVKIQNAACCEGTNVYEGNLCWYSSDSGRRIPGQPGCPGGFRAPTLAELHGLWTALGNSRYIANLGSRGAVCEATDDLLADEYVTTDSSGQGRYYTWDFGQGQQEDTSYTTAVETRCVRSL